MIWQDMSAIQKQDIINKYNDIKKQIKQLNSIKANYEKKIKYTNDQLNEYHNKIALLQNTYNSCLVNFKCCNCNKVFQLSLNQFKNLIKDNSLPLFCNVSCSGKYYAKKSHEGKTLEQKQLRNTKISKSMKKFEKSLTKSQKEIKYNNLNKYWNDLSKEDRRIRNTENALKTINKYKDNNYIWHSKDEDIIFNYLTVNNIETKKQIYNKGFLFDFVILYKGQYTYIELNGNYWHNNRPFNNSIEDINEYNLLLNKNKQSRVIADKWRYRDVSKLNFCKENNLNFICIYFDRQIKQYPEKVGKIVIENLNKGIKILLLNNINFADIG